MKTGDTVSVLNDTLTGRITAIRGEEITLEDEHGFEHTFPRTQIVPRKKSLYEGIAVHKKKESGAASSKKHDKNPVVLDLHFRSSGKNSGKSTVTDMVFLQRQKLLETLDYCRQHHLKKLEIIHGVGDGKLQKMVHDVLDSQTGLEYHDREILPEQSGAVAVFFL